MKILVLCNFYSFFYGSLHQKVLLRKINYNWYRTGPSFIKRIPAFDRKYNRVLSFSLTKKVIGVFTILRTNMDNIEMKKKYICFCHEVTRHIKHIANKLWLGESETWIGRFNFYCI